MTFRLLLPALAGLGLAACTTTASPDLRVGDVHFPTRAVDNLNDATLSTFRGDLVQQGNCLYLTKVQGRNSDRRFVVTWPSNSRLERERKRGGSVLEVVSMGAEFNDNTRSVAEIPSRVEVLGRVVNAKFEPDAPRLKNTVQRDCQGSGYVQVRTWTSVGPATAASMR